jgi:hypothetical protein
VTKEFTHPLARASRVYWAEGLDGSEQSVLVIVTTIELDPKHDRYDDRLVEKLSRAARGYLAVSSEAAAFLLVNPLEDGSRRDFRRRFAPKRG